ncbi:MAG: LPS export ABC transporter periplasmic protein LptC [Micavibrio sp.]|nr:LPS export ABC transporter periplasmic protein LptC [Micavibrio sp.]|tara:strand:+ start:281 stop:943 length:663 start_codon:yes stop_codon:yes gene_type:complete
MPPKQDKQSKERLNSLNIEERSHANNIHGYSRFIRWMRVVVPIGLILLILSLFTWPQFQESMPELAQSEDGMDISQAQNTLVNPRYESLDNALRPYVVTAQRAELKGLKKEDVYLTAPRGHLIFSPERILDVKADNGIYNQEKQTLTLTNNVTLKHSEGYSLTTQSMFVDLKQGIAQSDEQVEITSPIGTLTAPSMVITDEGDNIRFNGPSSLTVELNRD